MSNFRCTLTRNNISHHTVWRTWLFITFSEERWLCCQFSLPHLYISYLKGWENVLLRLGVKGFNQMPNRSNADWLPWEQYDSSPIRQTYRLQAHRIPSSDHRESFPREIRSLVRSNTVSFYEWAKQISFCFVFDQIIARRPLSANASLLEATRDIC